MSRREIPSLGGVRDVASKREEVAECSEDVKDVRSTVRVPAAIRLWIWRFKT